MSQETPPSEEPVVVSPLAALRELFVIVLEESPSFAATCDTCLALGQQILEQTPAEAHEPLLDRLMLLAADITIGRADFTEALTAAAEKAKPDAEPEPKEPSAEPQPASKKASKKVAKKAAAE